MTEPVLVAATVECTGRDAETILSQAHDGQVRAEPAVMCEHGGVDRAPNWQIALVDHHLLDVGHDIGAGHLEHLERRDVHQTAVLAQVEMLCIGDGAPPAGIPFVSAVFDAVFLDEIGVRFVPVRPLPAARLEIEGAELVSAGLRRAAGHIATRCPLFSWVHDPVGLVEVLVGPCLDVDDIAVLGVEARDVGAVWVGEAGVAVGHPFGHQPADAGALLDPHRCDRP